MSDARAATEHAREIKAKLLEWADASQVTRPDDQAQGEMRWWMRQAAEMLTAPPALAEGREGMVTVYDHEGRYLGCMGVGRWQLEEDTP